MGCNTRRGRGGEGRSDSYQVVNEGLDEQCSEGSLTSLLTMQSSAQAQVHAHFSRQLDEHCNSLRLQCHVMCIAGSSTKAASTTADLFKPEVQGFLVQLTCFFMSVPAK